MRVLAAPILKYFNPRGRIKRLLGPLPCAPTVNLQTIFDSILLSDRRFPLALDLKQEGWSHVVGAPIDDRILRDAGVRTGTIVWEHPDHPTSYLATWHDISGHLANYQATLISAQTSAAAMKKMAFALLPYKQLFTGKHPVTRIFERTNVKYAWNDVPYKEHRISASCSSSSVGYRYATKLSFRLIDTSNLSTTLFPQGVSCILAQRDYEWR